MMKGRNVDDYEISKFRLDRSLLPYADKEIASRMRMDAGNYCRIVNGQKSLTANFLKKFYIAFDTEVGGGNVGKLRKSYLSDEMTRINVEFYGLFEELHRLIYDLHRLSQRADFAVSQGDRNTTGESRAGVIEKFG
jgi:transcriptional regulator with XRE-family HTH domain